MFGALGDSAQQGPCPSSSRQEGRLRPGEGPRGGGRQLPFGFKAGAVRVQGSVLLGPEEAPGRVRAAAGLAPRALSGPGTRASGRDEPAGQPGSSRVRVPFWAPGSEESPGDAGSPRAPARPGGGRARPRGQIATETSEPRASSAAGLRGPGLFFRSTFSFYFIRESLMFQFFKDRSVPSEKSHLVVCGAKRGAGPSRERRAAGSAQAGAVGSPSPARPRARPPAGGPPTSRTW